MIKKIQLYVSDYKINTDHGFYYLSNDGVSKFKNEEEHDSLIGSDQLNYNFKYKKCFPELFDDLNNQQNESTWIKDALDMVNNF